jgi:hypothetical protein
LTQASYLWEIRDVELHNVHCNVEKAIYGKLFFERTYTKLAGIEVSTTGPATLFSAQSLTIAMAMFTLTLSILAAFCGLSHHGMNCGW